MAWEPQLGPQTSAITANWCDELFFGGQRGGGKSDFQLGYQEDGALEYGQGWRGIMFRKSYPELEELQARAMEIFPGEGATYKSQPSGTHPFSNCWYWPNGATVQMRYIEHERDYGRYHGRQFTGISFDEVTEYASPVGLFKMLSCLRSASGVPCTVRLTGNPGGVGHAWVKQRYIDSGPPMLPYHDAETGLTRMFIPSRTEDNAILLRMDPDYKQRILAATQGNEALREAWLNGNWDIVAGAFFTEWAPSRHVTKPFEIPAQWGRFVSGDWGSARPFAFIWWAVVSDDHRIPDGRTLPRGALVAYREHYGCANDTYGNPIYNTGVKLPAEQVGRDLVSRSGADTMGVGVLDPACFASDGGPSIAERLHIGTDHKLLFRPADNTRIARRGALGGWDTVRSRLVGEAEERPMIVFFNSCAHSVRTLPIMQHDEKNIEDLNSDGEDHAVDAVRYACNSRPWAKPSEIKPAARFPQQMTINEIIKMHARN